MYEDVFGDKIHLRKIKALVEYEQSNPQFTELSKKLYDRKLVGLKGVLELKVLDTIDETQENEKEEPKPEEKDTPVVSSVRRIPDRNPAGKLSSALSSALRKIMAAHQTELS